MMTVPDVNSALDPLKWLRNITKENLFFCPGLSHNVGRFVAALKRHEALTKRPPANAQFMAYGSTKKDDPILVAKWPTDTAILPWHLYMIGKFSHSDITTHNEEDRPIHVNFSSIIILNPPVDLRDTHNPKRGGINRGGCFADGQPKRLKLDRVYNEIIDRIQRKQYVVIHGPN